MNILLVSLTFVGVLALAIARALAVDEIKGRLQSRIRKSVERTIGTLPAELQLEWADEWRAELVVVIAMPMTAAKYGGSEGDRR